MAVQYPGSVKTFTTKVDFADTVLAEHVNSLQDEVNALEANLGTYIKTGSGWIGTFDQTTTAWNTLKDRIANIEYGLYVAYNTNTSTLGGSTIQPSTTTTVGLIVKAKASQTADLVDFQTSDGTTISKVDASGNLYTSGKQLVPIVYSATQPSSVPAGTIWVDSSSSIAPLTAQSGIPSGGTSGQSLVKNSNTDFDVTWGTISAETLAGTTIKSTVTGSSLTSVGTLTNLTVTNPISGSVTGSAGSVAAANLTGTTLASGVTGSSLTSVGTLTSLSVTNAVTAGSLTGDGSGIKNIQSSDYGILSLMGAWV